MYAVDHIHEVARSLGVVVTPAKQRPYYPNAAWKMLARALGWNPRKAPIPKRITDYDSAYQRQLAEKVIPFPADPKDPVTIDQVARRVAAGAARHARAAGRDVVIDTASNNEAEVSDQSREIVIDVDSEDEMKAAQRATRGSGEVSSDRYIRSEKSGGVVLGWARVLTGSENCAFCAMLASRGPVYSELTVLTAGSDSDRDGLAFHDWCDCKAVLVVKGQPWEGEQQFKQLQDLWDDARDNPTDEELEQGLNEPRDRFNKRYSEALAEDPQQFATFDEDAANSKDAVSESGIPSEDAGTGIAGSVFETPGPDGDFVLPAEYGFPKEKLHTLYGRGLDEYPRLDAPETMEESAKQTARVHSFANCVRATAAAVMRMKGYDVHPYASMYSSSKDGLQILQALEMWETDAGPVEAIETTADTWEDAISAMPDGSYGVFSFEVDQMAQRHVILWRKAVGGKVFVDPQQGDEPVIFGEDFDINPKAQVVIARLDNAHPVGSETEDVILPFTTQEV